jgi:protein TonB
VSVIPYYRVYELPWTPSEEEQRRLRRVLGAVLGVFIAFGVIIPLLPERPHVPAMAPAVPERIVEFILKQPQPEPPPPPKPEPREVLPPEPVAKPVVVEKAPVTKPQPVATEQPKPDARETAAASGLLALADQLADLRERDVDTGPSPQTVSSGAGEKVRVERALLTAKVGEGSGGIAVSASSSGFGGGGTQLKGHATAKVAPTDSLAAAAEVRRSGSSGQASRTREEVELVFDRNKAAIYALYSRALRDNPELQGKVVLEVTISAAGAVTACRIVSSELGDPDLERKLVSRVKMFRFEAKDVAPMTTTKPIEFFPA